MGDPYIPSAMTDALERHYAVTVVMKKVWRLHRQWRYPSWQVSGVLPADCSGSDYNSQDARTGLGENADQQDTRQLTDDDGNEHFIWSDLPFSLYRDGLTSYFQNLSSPQPYLFVLCREDSDKSALEPFLVSADFADAEAHMETEGTVLTAPLNAPFNTWIADYVLQNKTYLEKQAHDGKKHKRKKATTRL